jgi:hypothetical protein
VAFNLARKPLKMQLLDRLGQMLLDRVKSDTTDATEELDTVMQLWLERRQPLEWVLKQALLGQGMSLTQVGRYRTCTLVVCVLQVLWSRVVWASQ